MPNNRMSGNLIGLKIKGTYVSCEMSVVFNFETDIRGASPIMEGRWKEGIPGIRSWSVSLDAATLIRMAGTGLNTVISAFLTGERIFIEFATKDVNLPNLILSGYVYVQSGSITASVNTRSSWNTTLIGDGPFTAGLNSNVFLAIATDKNKNIVLGDQQDNIIVGKNG